METIDFISTDEIIRFAIKEESDASAYYAQQAKMTSIITLKMLWEQLSNDEIRHKTILSSLLEKMENGDKSLTFNSQDLNNLSLPKIPEKEYSEEEKVIIQAIYKENDAFFMYKTLSENITNAVHKNILQTLAKEELKHCESLLIELNL
jgi:rubrerythrin